MEQLKIDHTPHCSRHSCISMLAEAGVDQKIIKKTLGHSGAMTLIENVYTLFDIKELVDGLKLRSHEKRTLSSESLH
ncbi:MAG TPA: integrase [Lachnoclostridium phytofermentans]|uniref:Integrase n=1 Tax=Lachnoclostridium phytofermentans TaxID=66219 RepID=A0A3D2X9T3_9FIRM|nr:integrase [Lachnoclostridium phytofermentans]